LPMSAATPQEICEKSVDQFRNFVDSPYEELVSKTYRLNHTYQTVEFVAKQKEQHLSFSKGTMSLWDMFKRLEKLVDESDPDNNLPQIFHAIQTAETLRRDFPQHDWLHLVGLIHDLGKMLVLPEFGEHPQWAVVGDTFPVGCAFSPKICKALFFCENPDVTNFRYNTLYGIYQPECGLAKLEMSWGHDEYMYQVLVHNGCTLPQLGLNIIRFHSFYVWHRDGGYSYLMNDEDHETLKWCQRFSQADLYSKADKVPTQEDIDALLPYYQGLVAKYLPKEKLDW
jgi:inositol oxygenase